MGILVHSQPSAYGLAHNDNPYVFRSTNYTTTQRFKVMVLPSTYPTDPAISTARVYPRQGIDVNGVVTSDRAYYDPSRILQTQVGSDIAIPAANHAGIFNATNMHTEYGLFLQEEDLVGGVYVGGASFSVNVKSVWNGVRNEIDWLDFDYTDYNTSVVGKKFLSDAPATRYIDSDQSAFLHFLSVGAASGKGVAIASYDSDGVQVSTGVIDGASMINNEYCYVACGTYDIENSDPSSVISHQSFTIIHQIKLPSSVIRYIDKLPINRPSGCYVISFILGNFKHMRGGCMGGRGGANLCSSRAWVTTCGGRPPPAATPKTQHRGVYPSPSSTSISGGSTPPSTQQQWRCWVWGGSTIAPT